MASPIAEKYAAAYFNVAKEKKILKKASNDLKVLENIISHFKEIFIEVNSPIFTKSKRFLFVRKLFVPYRFHLITKNLLYSLAEYRRIDSLKQIINCWNNLYLNYKSEIKIKVISVKKINHIHLTYIKKFFEKKFGKQVQLQNILDPSILGGIIIRFGSFILDGSVANQIRDIGFTLEKEIQARI